jgi:hypothetical protein
MRRVRLPGRQILPSGPPLRVPARHQLLPTLSPRTRLAYLRLTSVAT